MKNLETFFYLVAAPSVFSLGFYGSAFFLLCVDGEIVKPLWAMALILSVIISIILMIESIILPKRTNTKFVKKLMSGVALLLLICNIAGLLFLDFASFEKSIFFIVYAILIGLNTLPCILTGYYAYKNPS